MIDIHKLQSISKELNVLYVEDDEFLRHKTAQIFEQLFAKVDVAENGKIALEMFEHYQFENNRHYDIVISDIQMPNMDGIELSRRLLQEWPGQKVIITSAHNDKEYLIELINIGVAGFLEKPLSMEQMIEIIGNVVSLLNSSKCIDLGDGFRFDGVLKALFCGNTRVDLSEHEIKLLDLLCMHPSQHFSPIDIFNHIHYDNPDKEYSEDSIKSLIKRIRRKLPEEIIVNTPKLGYHIKPLS